MTDEKTAAAENALQLRISTELAPGVGLPSEIAFNYDELKSQLTAYVAKYDNLVVGEDDVPEARRIRADINGVIGQLTKAGTETKAKWNAPLDVFMRRVKELVGIARPIEAKIGDQIKAFDASRRAEKRNTLVEYLGKRVKEAAKGLAGGVAESFAAAAYWQRVVKDEWLAQSYSVKRAEAAIDEVVRKCVNDMELIAHMYGGRGEGCADKAAYALIRWDFDSQTAIREIDRQFDEERKIAERRRAEAERKAQEAAKAAQTASSVPSPVQPSPQPVAKADSMEAAKAELAARRGTPQPQTPPEMPAPQVAADVPEGGNGDEPEMTYTLRITGKRSSLFALRNWLNENGLRFEKV